MNLINRTKSIITNEENLEHLFTIKDCPVFMGCVESPQESDLFADMEWAIDPESGIIQLERLIPLDILYQNSHNDGTGKVWEEYYQAFSAFIENNGQPKNILEIGGGAGRLAEIYTKNIKGSLWTIIEPNPLHQETKQIKIINDFFDGNNVLDKKFDVIVFSQVLEHMYNPTEFIKNVSKYLNKDGLVFIGHPDLEYFLRNKHTNTLNFEHTIFLTDYFVRYLLEAHDLEIINFQHYPNRDFFYCAKKTESHKESAPLHNQYYLYKEIFTDFISYHQKLVAELNEKIKKTNGEVFLFGAHIFSQSLISFGLNTSKIKGVLDNSPIKQGKRLYGTSFSVMSPEILRGKVNGAVILKVGIYRDEILNQLREINPRIQIFE